MYFQSPSILSSWNRDFWEIRSTRVPISRKHRSASCCWIISLTIGSANASGIRFVRLLCALLLLERMFCCRGPGRWAGGHRGADRHISMRSHYAQELDATAQCYVDPQRPVDRATGSPSVPAGSLTSPAGMWASTLLECGQASSCRVVMRAGCYGGAAGASLFWIPGPPCALLNIFTWLWIKENRAKRNNEEKQVALQWMPSSHIPKYSWWLGDRMKKVPMLHQSLENPPK